MRVTRPGRRNGGGAIERLEDRRLLSVQVIEPEFQVNTYTTNGQGFSVVGLDNAGNFVVVWQGEGSGDSVGIFAQRYNAQGLAQGTEFRVNTYTFEAQRAPSIAMDADGDFVIAWQSYGQDRPGLFLPYGVYAQRYNAAGVPQGGEFLVNTYTTDSQSGPSVAMDVDGNFVVAWQSDGQNGSSFGIYAQRYNSAGLPQGAEFPVNSYTALEQASPTVAMDNQGDFVVSWRSGGQDGHGDGVYARRYDANGIPLSDEFRVNSSTSGDQTNPSAAMDADGNFVVAWFTDQNGPSSVWRVFAQRYDSAGVSQGGEFAASSIRSQRAKASMDADGDFAIVWGLQLDGSDNGVFARRYSSAGVAQGAEFRVNATTANNQNGHGVAMNDDGDFIVAWGSTGQDGSGDGIFAHRYTIVPNVSASTFAFHTAPHQMQFTFDENISASLGTDDVVVQNLTTMLTIPSSDFSVAYDALTNTGAFSYTGNAGGIPGVLPEGNYRAMLLAAGVTTPNGNPLPADHVLNFHFLNGDANHDARVNLDDFNILASNFGQTGRDFTQGNFDYDAAGTVNLDDFNILASRFGQQVAPAASIFAGKSVGSDRIADQIGLFGARSADEVV